MVGELASYFDPPEDTKNTPNRNSRSKNIQVGIIPSIISAMAAGAQKSKILCEV